MIEMLGDRAGMIRVVDFFSGCGGTSFGFQRAGLDVLAGIDFDKDASATYRRNITGAKTLENDIRNVATEEIADFLGFDRRPLLFCGCAPCQPFSKQNRNCSDADPRRNLLAEFSRFVHYWKPEFLFLENVPGMQNVKASTGPLSDFLYLISELGYSYSMRIWSALEFGVPQNRDRLIIVASRIGSPPLPSTGSRYPEKRPILRDWIGDLPPIKAGGKHDKDPNHRAASLSEKNLARIAATPEGGSRQSWPPQLRLPCHSKHGGHSDVYGRLSWDKPAACLTTRCTSYSNGRFGHPEQNRALSVREAACLQTFPRNYEFIGGIESCARQIGNAVPPLVAQRFGESFLSSLI